MGFWNRALFVGAFFGVLMGMMAFPALWLIRGEMPSIESTVGIVVGGGASVE